MWVDPGTRKSKVGRKIACSLRRSRKTPGRGELPPLSHAAFQTAIVGQSAANGTDARQLSRYVFLRIFSESGPSVLRGRTEAVWKKKSTEFRYSLPGVGRFFATLNAKSFETFREESQSASSTQSRKRQK